MPWRVFGVRLPVDGDEQELIPKALKRAGISRAALARAVVVRKSLDRRGSHAEFTYSLDLYLHDGRRPAHAGRRQQRGQVRWVETQSPQKLRVGETPLEAAPVVIGSGPAGLFAALWLARAGFCPRVIERGEAMNLRVRRIRDLNRSGRLDPESNYLFGEGGAGTFSDGKLTSRSKDPRSEWVLEEFRRLSGIDSVVYHYRPHLGSERIRTVVGRLRTELKQLGAHLEFGCKATGLRLQDGRVRAVQTARGEIPAQVVVLAPGHSAREFMRTLFRQGVAMEPKAFQMGFRIEHPQEFVDRAIFGSLSGHPALGPADYRLVAKLNSDSVFSFCMCPGGEIMAAISDLGHMNTNGMSHTGCSSGFANSGLVTTVEPEKFGVVHPLGGLELQEVGEALAAEAVGHTVRVPAQRLEDYLADKLSDSLPAHSCQSGVVPARLAPFIPEPVDRILRASFQRLDAQMPGFVGPAALLVGPESRSSSPVRLLRDPQTLESCGTQGLYPVGEGAGYAGGIVSAAIDGMRAAERVIERFAPAKQADTQNL